MVRKEHALLGKRHIPRSDRVRSLRKKMFHTGEGLLRARSARVTFAAMRLLLACLLLAAGCSSSSDQATPCPVDKQFCLVPSDAGCTITKLTCCDNEVPTCAGTYNAGNPNGCTALPAQGECL